MVVEFLLGMIGGAVITGVAWRIQYERDHLFVVG